MAKYSSVGLAVGIAISLSLVVETFAKEQTWAFLITTVIICAWQGGQKMGLLATFLTTLSAYIFSELLEHNWLYSNSSTPISLGLFALQGTVLSWAIGNRKWKDINKAKPVNSYDSADSFIPHSQNQNIDLIKTNERFRLAAQVLGCIIYDWDVPSGKVEYAYGINEFFGYTLDEQESTNYNWRSRIHPDDRTKTNQAVWQAISNPEAATYSIEYRVNTCNDQYLYVRDHGAILRNEQGQAQRVVGCTIDLSDQRHTQEQLEQGKQFIERVAQATPGLIYIYDLTENRNVYVSGQIESLTGYTPEQLQKIRNECFEDLMHPEDFVHLSTLVDKLSNAVDGEIVKFEYRIRHANGEWRWFASQDIVFSRNPDGSVRQVLGVSVDITERYRVADELRQSEALARAKAAELEAFMEAVPAGVWIASDPQCHHVTPNRAAYEMMRRSPDDVMTATPADGKYPFQFKIQKNGQEVASEDLPMQRAGRTGQATSGEFDFIFENGEVCSLYGKAVPVRYESGEIRGVIGAFIDITARKKAETALRESQERLALALDAARIGSWDWNLITNETIWSPYHEMIFGYTPGNPKRTYQEWCDRVHPDDLSAAQAAAEKAMAEKRDYACEYRTIWQDGSIHWVSSFGRFHYDEEGKPIRMLGMLFDISDRKQAEAALQESELMFRTLANTMPQLFWVIRPDCYHEYCNQRWFEYTGLTIEHLHGKGWHQIIHPEDLTNTTNAFAIASKTGTLFTVEHRLRRSDGEYRWHLEQAFPLQDHKGQIIRWFGSSTDIHDQKLLVEERAQALERERAARMELERASRMKDEFLAVVSHELRSPLSAILGWSRLLRTRSFDAAIVEQALASIERNAQAQTQLIEDLLDISRIIRGQIRLYKRPIRLRQVITSAIDTVQPTADSKGIAVHIHYETLHDVVLGDPERLQQIVWNLLSNAIKFSNSGGHVDVYITTGDGQNSNHSDRYVQIRVQDTGKGISPEFLPYVFERFRQAESTTTRAQGGLGLGLAIVRNLVELHNGKIHAESSGLGQGAAFVLSLPICVDEAKLEINTLNNPSYETELELESKLKNLRILIVDDEPDMRDFFSTVLKRYSSNVMTAPSAQKALQLLESWQPDVLLSDIGMPHEDGYTLIQAIRNLPNPKLRNIPVAAITAYAREEDRQQALKAGFNLHVPKPIEPLALIKAVITLNSQINQNKSF